jgi:peptidoglycan/LPS O-acetylase OafA/YrhL
VGIYNPIEGYILWSVVCEAIYYCLYPLILPLARRIGWVMLISLSVIASYSIAIGLGSDQYGNAQIYGPQLNWVVALPAWLLGCYLAENFDRIRLPGTVWSWRISTAVTASVLYWATINTPVGFYLTMVPFSALAGCWLLAEINNAADRAPISSLEAIGKGCFSIYLVHTIAAAAAEKFLTSNPIGACVFALAMVYPFYRLVEVRFHDLARRAKKALDELERSRRLKDGIELGQ